MKRIFKTACLLLLCMTMMLSSMLPVYAYKAMGTELLEKGKVSEGEAIFINIFEYFVTIAGEKVEDIVTDKIDTSLGYGDDIEDIIRTLPGGNAVIEVYKLFETSAYTFYDLGKALNALRGQRKESFEELCDLYKKAIDNFWDTAKTVYNTGKKYRDTTKQIHDMTNYNGTNFESCFHTLANTANTLDKAKSEKVFNSKCKTYIKIMVDILNEMHGKMPSMQAVYNLGRFGSFHVPKDMVFIKTETPCFITSKSTGKLLNVYTSAAAKKIKNGVNVNVYKYVEADADTQTFAFVDNGDGSYRIRINDAKKYIDVYNTSTKRIARNGAKVHVWDKNTDHWRDQSFKFECEDGYYRILLAADPKYCLYVKSNGYLALGKTKEGNSSQLWKIVYQD